MNKNKKISYNIILKTTNVRKINMNTSIRFLGASKYFS